MSQALPPLTGGRRSWGTDMFIVGNLLGALAHVVSITLTILYWLVLIRALISWVNPDPTNAIVQFLHGVTEPVLEPLRRLLPTWRLGIDLSPFLAVLLLIFLEKFLVATLMELSLRLR